MSRRKSKNFSVNSSDDDDKESVGKIPTRKDSSSSSLSSSRHSNRPKSTEKRLSSFSPSRKKDKTSSSDSSSDERDQTRPVSRPKSNLRLSEKDLDSDSESDSTIKKSAKSSDESLDKFRNSRTQDRKRQILKSSSSSSRSRSNSSVNSEKKAYSDLNNDSTTLGSSIQVKIDSKPPIDKDRHNRRASSRQSYFEKPDSESESDSKIGSHRSNNLNKQSELFDPDSQDSSDMTDVSSIPSPKQTKKKFLSEKFDEDEPVSRGRRTFYNALHQKSHTRPNSVNFNLSHNYNNSVDFSEKTYGRELMRIEAQQRRMFSDFLKENIGKSRNIERPVRITSSAINRQREQQRIEKENQLILKRLLSVKSSKEVRRDNQLKDYEKNMGISDLNLSRSSVKSGLSTKRSQKSSICNSRVSSAKSNRGQTPLDYSNRTLSCSRRPEWNNRW